MDDNDSDAGGAVGGVCPTCGQGPDAAALVDRDGNAYSHALPMQLLDSIDVNLARRADSSGHAVVESNTGIPLVTGRTAQGTWDAAQDIATQLGRRRVQAAIDGGDGTKAQTGRESGSAATGSMGPGGPAVSDYVTRRGSGASGAGLDGAAGGALAGLTPWPLQRVQENDGYLFTRDANSPPAPDHRLLAGRGGAYAPDKIVAHSHYSDPIVHADGDVTGVSRRAGDASAETQGRVMGAIVSAGKAAGMTDHQIALTLAIARHESGFNPDAAAGTTSASGLGQFTDRTGAHYGLDKDNRWDMNAQASALVRHTMDNIDRANAQGHDGSDLDRYTYAYHHDGPSLKYGGLAIAEKSVVPLVDLYQGYVRSQHVR